MVSECQSSETFFSKCYWMLLLFWNTCMIVHKFIQNLSRLWTFPNILMLYIANELQSRRFTATGHITKRWTLCFKTERNCYFHNGCLLDDGTLLKCMYYSQKKEPWLKNVKISRHLWNEIEKVRTYRTKDYSVVILNLR